jgi:hypothetical protein
MAGAAKIRVQVAFEYPEGWTERERDSERRHRERMATISADEEQAVMRGHRAGYDLGWKEGQAAVLAGLKMLQGEPVVGPTDYEVWRDALQLAIANINDGESLSLEEMLSMAEWFHDRLKAGPPQPSEPDCPHCGADSSMDHNDDCPNADDVHQADEDPTDDEVDCVRCGAPPGRHPDGCPTIAGP